MSALGSSVIRFGFDRAAKTLIYVVGAVLGGVLGVAVPHLARWAAGSGFPLPGPLELAGALDSAWTAWGGPLIGVVAGAAFAAYVIHQSPVLHIGDESIEVAERGSTRHIRRTNVAGIYRDGNKIVVESSGGRRLFRGEVEGKRDEVRDAFVTKGYPWESD